MAARASRASALAAEGEAAPVPARRGLGRVDALGPRSRRAIQSFERLPLDVRLAHAPVALFGYVRRIFWPTDLACHVPHPALLGETPPQAWSTASILALLGALALAAVAPFRKPWSAAAWAGPTSCSRR